MAVSCAAGDGVPVGLAGGVGVGTLPLSCPAGWGLGVGGPSGRGVVGGGDGEGDPLLLEEKLDVVVGTYKSRANLNYCNNVHVCGKTS